MKSLINLVPTSQYQTAENISFVNHQTLHNSSRPDFQELTLSKGTLDLLTNSREEELPVRDIDISKERNEQNQHVIDATLECPDKLDKLNEKEESCPGKDYIIPDSMLTKTEDEIMKDEEDFKQHVLNVSQEVVNKNIEECSPPAENLLRKTNQTQSNQELKLTSQDKQQIEENQKLFQSDIQAYEVPRKRNRMDLSPDASVRAQMISIDLGNKIDQASENKQSGYLSPTYLSDRSASNSRLSRRIGRPESLTLLERIKDGIENSDSTKRSKIEEILRSRINQISSKSHKDQQGRSFSKSLRRELREYSKSRGSHRTIEKQLSKVSLKSKSSPTRYYINQEISHQPLYYLSDLANSLTCDLAEEIHEKIKESDSYAYTDEDDSPEADLKLTKEERKNKKFLGHYHHCLQSIAYINTLEKLNEDDFIEKKVYLPPKSQKWKKTIILDLDETLVHCDEDLSKPKQMQIPIKFTGGEIVDCGVTIRPFAKEFIALVSQFFEIVVFTASHSCYANMILNLLDPNHEFITYRMFRDSCIETEEGIFVKDLRIFANRNIEDIIIVDNACYSYAFQITNGIPIVPFFFNQEDTQLIELSNFLMSLVGVREQDLMNLDSHVHKILEEFFSQEVNEHQKLNLAKYQRIVKPHLEEKKSMREIIDFYFRGSAFIDFVTEYSNQASLYLQPVLLEFVDGIESLNFN